MGFFEVVLRSPEFSSQRIGRSVSTRIRATRLFGADGFEDRTPSAMGILRRFHLLQYGKSV
jgi:hypothetical protein